MKTKGELLEKYAGKSPRNFIQYDVWYAPNYHDDMFPPDGDGFSGSISTTTELMEGATVRILINPGTTTKQAMAALKRAKKWIKHDLESRTIELAQTVAHQRAEQLPPF